MRSILLFAALLWLGVVAAQPCFACSNATLQGNYGFVLSGVNNAAALTATVGQITGDGLGGLTGSETVSDSGVIASNVSLTGRYELHKNCTGTATLTPAGGSASNYSLVVTGTQIQIVETDNGFTESGYAQAQGNANCSNAGIQGTLGFHGGGWKVSNTLTPTAFAAQVQADGAGNVSGAERGSFGGLVFSVSLSGTYLVNANCTGTITYTASDGSTTHGNFVLVNGGMSALTIQTDAGVITTTLAQKF